MTSAKEIKILMLKEEYEKEYRKLEQEAEQFGLLTHVGQFTIGKKVQVLRNIRDLELILKDE